MTSLKKNTQYPTTKSTMYFSSPHFKSRKIIIHQNMNESKTKKIVLQ